MLLLVITNEKRWRRTFTSLSHGELYTLDHISGWNAREGKNCLLESSKTIELCTCHCKNTSACSRRMEHL